MEYDSNAFFINPVISIVTRNPSIIRRTSPPTPTKKETYTVAESALKYKMKQ